jgi:hypothetical protein
MTREQRFRFIVRGLLAIGIAPTPTKLNRFLGRMHRRRTNQINGREAAWRRQEMLAAGWTAPRQTNLDRYWDEHTNWTRWEKPA